MDETRNLPEYDNHEEIIPFEEAGLKLKGFVAIHNTNLGPATGGTRFLSYPDSIAALKDVLNLSRAMSYKCALAGLPFGGGKAVIIGDSTVKSPEFFRGYGKIIDKLEGRFTTGTDVGITDADADEMRKSSRYILGKKEKGKASTSIMAARGVLAGLRAVCEILFGSQSFSGRTFAVKGLGKLGGFILEELVKNGSRIWAAEINPVVRDYYRNLLPQIEFVGPEEIQKIPADVYIPCALGREFDESRAATLKTRAVVGGANNQLVNDSAGDILYNRNILYAPDYIVNAGGLINIVDELEQGGYQGERVEKRTNNIFSTLMNIFSLSEKNKLSPHRIANLLAEEKIYGQK